MNILIPIVENEIQGIETPYGRSLYEIERKTILQHVFEQLSDVKNAKFIFVLNKSDIQQNHLNNVIRLLAPTAEIVVADGRTAGGACSCLLAIDKITLNEPLIIAGGDQMVTEKLSPIVEKFVENDWDGGIIYFNDIHPRWSYIKINDEGFVTQAAEKLPISHNATTGFYYYKKAEDFVNAAFSMIRKKSSIDGKYYVCPTFNEMVLHQKKIGTHLIDKFSYFNFSHSKGAELYSEHLRKRLVNENV